jgi:hypothetical protein
MPSRIRTGTSTTLIYKDLTLLLLKGVLQHSFKPEQIHTVHNHSGVLGLDSP